MSDKRLSEIMSDTIYAISQAQETLDDAITEAINMHFDAGIQVERERIIKSMQDRYDQILEVEGIVVGQERLDLLIELMEEITGIGHLKKREQE